VPVVRVTFISSFRPAFDGADFVEIRAETLRQLLRALVKKYPRLQKLIDEGIALAVDGEIYRDNLDIEIPEKSEVYLMPRIQGG
jgi:molybdopterin converting factor small subunit